MKKVYLILLLGFVDLYSSPFPEENGGETRLLVCTRELSVSDGEINRYREEQALEAEAQRRADEVSKTRGRAQVHDLANIINGISMGVDLGVEDEDLKEDVQGQISELLQRMKDINGQELGSLVSIPELLVEAQRECENSAKDGVSVEVNIDDTLTKHLEEHSELKGYAGRLGRILGNLGSNAARCTENGIIGFQLSLDKVNGAGFFAKIHVVDTGCGVPADQVSKLFENGTQGDPKTRGKFGLGLFTCKELVQKSGGSLWVKSVEGEGTDFSFTFPFLYAKEDK